LVRMIDEVEAVDLFIVKTLLLRLHLIVFK
jgi:hypothetical protein